MNATVCYPGAERKQALKCAANWRERGWRTLVMFDPDIDPNPQMVAPSPFPGYYRVINAIVARAFEEGADIVAAIGDDMEPPEAKAEEVARMYMARFPDGFGVLQATGDPSGKDGFTVPAAARICGSPIFGKEWARRAFGGNGPFGDYGFRSFFADEMLHDVAERLGVLWNEPGLAIMHNHWSFGRMPRKEYHIRAQANWEADQALYLRLKAEGFPRSEPLK